MATQTPGGGGTGATSISQPLSEGILYAVSIFCDADLETPFEVYIDVDICRAGTNPDNRINHLISGYITEDESLSWSGFFEAGPDDSLRVAFRGNLNPVYRITYQQLTVSANKVFMEYLRHAISTT